MICCFRVSFGVLKSKAGMSRMGLDKVHLSPTMAQALSVMPPSRISLVEAIKQAAAHAVRKVATHATSAASPSLLVQNTHIVAFGHKPSKAGPTYAAQPFSCILTQAMLE